MNIMVVGNGGSGKDTFAKFLSEADPLNFIYNEQTATTSFHISLFLYHLHNVWKTGISLDEFHNTRRDLRKLWFLTGEYILARDGEAALVKMCLGAGNNIVTGVRTDEEVKAAKKLGIIDYVVEVQRDFVPEDPTYSVEYESIDVFIDNSGGLGTLMEAVKEFLMFLEVEKNGIYS